MRVLIVENNPELASLWSLHLRRNGGKVSTAATQADAIACLDLEKIDVIILDLMLNFGNALAIADYASFRHPHVRVIFVTNNSFFSDGSIFRHIPNACAYLPIRTSPEDLAAVVGHYSLAS